MPKLSCRICGFEAFDLVEHIETEHGLESYIEAYNPADEELIHPSVISEDETVKEVEVKVVGDAVEVHGVKLPVNPEPGDFVPEAIAAYHFPKFCEDIAADILEDRRMMLVGHTGTGKTSCIYQLAARTKNSVLRVNLNGQTTIGDFVGLWTVRSGDMKWVDGVLPQAMRKGYWLILDEIDFAESAILSVLNAVLERDGKLTLKENDGEIITPHPNFRVFATGNTVGCMSEYRGLYQGTIPMNDAFLDRWQVYKVDYLKPEDESKVLRGYIPKLTEAVSIKIVAVANAIRKAFEEEAIQSPFSTRRLIDWTEKMVRFKDPMRAAESTIFSKVNREDAEVIKGIIVRMMDPNREGRK